MNCGEFAHRKASYVSAGTYGEVIIPPQRFNVNR